MTTINCSLNCKYQWDGQCNLNNLCSLPISSNPDCSYFQPFESKARKKLQRINMPINFFF